MASEGAIKSYKEATIDGLRKGKGKDRRGIKHWQLCICVYMCNLLFIYNFYLW